METIEGKTSKLRNTIGIISFNLWMILGIVITTAIHYRLFTETHSGYQLNKFFKNYMWIDSLIGISISVAIFIVIIIGIAYYIKSKELLAQD